MSTTLEDIQEFADKELNPTLAAHGGRVDIHTYVDQKVLVILSGGCQGCASARMTLRLGIKRSLQAEFKDIEDVVDVTDHDAGANPYFMKE